jgi:hypothetical protein
VEHVTIPSALIAPLLRRDPEVSGPRVKVRVLTTSTGFPFEGHVIGFNPADEGAMIRDERTGMVAGYWDGELPLTHAEKLARMVEPATDDEVARVRDELERHEAQVEESEGKSSEPYQPSFPACYRRMLSKARKPREMSPVLKVEFDRPGTPSEEDRAAKPKQRA